MTSLPEWSANGTPISLGNLQSSFGGTNPIGIAEYFANTALVNEITYGFPDGIRTRVPETGRISLSNFYGAQEVLGNYAIVANITTANLGDTILFSVNSQFTNEVLTYTITPIFNPSWAISTNANIVAGNTLTFSIAITNYLTSLNGTYYYFLVDPASTTVFTGNLVTVGQRSNSVTINSSTTTVNVGVTNDSIASIQTFDIILVESNSSSSNLKARSTTITANVKPAGPVIPGGVPTISNVSLSPNPGFEGNTVNFTFTVTDTGARTIYWRVEPIVAAGGWPSTSYSDFGNISPNTVVTTSGNTTVSSSFNLITDVVGDEGDEQYNIKFYLDSNYTEPAFSTQGPYSILDTNILTGTAYSIDTTGFSLMTGSGATLPKSNVWVMFRMIGGGGMGGGSTLYADIGVDGTGGGGGSGGGGGLVRGVVRLPVTTSGKRLSARAGSGSYIGGVSARSGPDSSGINSGVGGQGGTFGAPNAYNGSGGGGGGGGPFDGGLAVGGGGGGASSLAYVISTVPATVIGIASAGGGGGGGGGSIGNPGGNAVISATSQIISNVNTIPIGDLQGLPGASLQAEFNETGGGGGGGGGNGGAGGQNGQDFVSASGGGANGRTLQNSALTWAYFERMHPTANSDIANTNIRFVANAAAKNRGYYGHGGATAVNDFRKPDGGFQGAVAVYWTTADAAPTDWNLVPDFPDIIATQLVTRIIAQTTPDFFNGIDFLRNGIVEIGRYNVLGSMEGRSFANPWTTSTHVSQPYYLTSLGSLYQIRAQIISGSSDDMISFSGSSFDTWHSLNPTNGDRVGWYIRPGRPSVTLGISIRNLSGTITSTAQFVIIANQVNQSGPPTPAPLSASIAPTQNGGWGPFYVNETTNNSITFNYTIINRAGQTIYWGVVGGTNNTSVDYTGSISGAINSDSGSFTVTISADNLTEGTETFTIQMWASAGAYLGTAFYSWPDVVTIGDTSLSPTPAPTTTANISVLNNGISGMFSYINQNQATNVYLYFQPNGTFYSRNGNGNNIVTGNWYTPTTTGIGNSYWIRWTPTVNSDVGADNYYDPGSGGWLSLASQRSFGVAAGANNLVRSIAVSYLIEIATDSGGSTIVTSATHSIEVDVASLE